MRGEVCYTTNGRDRKSYFFVLFYVVSGPWFVAMEVVDSQDSVRSDHSISYMSSFGEVSNLRWLLYDHI